jgi:large subunit ribosomal protein L7Ae
LFAKNKRSYRIGGDIMHKQDLTRFVKWPKYIQMQRQKRILMTRLKIPPQIAQFSHTLERDQAKKLFELLGKYKPETHKEKATRLQGEAANKVEGKKDEKVGPKPLAIKFGFNHITTLIENGTAKLVVIAHDVDPIELVLHIPTLCRKKGIPYAFVKGKARLGTFVHQKTATCVALTEVRKQDQSDLDTLSTNFKNLYNENSQLRKVYGGGVLGIKNRQMMAKRT